MALHFPHAIGLYDNRCHLPISKYCRAVPQGHAIQSDWRCDGKQANVFRLLIIYNGKGGFRGKLSSVLETPSLVNEVTSH